MAEAKEIYESKNKQGEVEFSDQPSPNAEVVDIQEPNIASSVDIPPVIVNEGIKKPVTPTQSEISTRIIRGDDDKNPERIPLKQEIRERVNDRPDGEESQIKSGQGGSKSEQSNWRPRRQK